MPLRTVGSHEYLGAIVDFDELVSLSSEEEIEVYNKIILEQDEYAIFSGNTLGIPDTKNPNSLVNQHNNLKPASGGFKRHSLQWMLALARVELGASLSMYGRIGNAFVAIRPGEFGMEEYNLLVADDAAAHIKAMTTDDEMKKHARSGDADSDTVAYLGRLKVVSDLIGYVEKNSPSFISESASNMKTMLRSARKNLSRTAEVATIDLEYRRGSTETNTNTSTDQRRSGPNDVIALEPITRNCQRAFLREHGRGAGQ